MFAHGKQENFICCSAIETPRATVYGKRLWKGYWNFQYVLSYYANQFCWVSWIHDLCINFFETFAGLNWRYLRTKIPSWLILIAWNLILKYIIKGAWIYYACQLQEFIFATVESKKHNVATRNECYLNTVYSNRSRTCIIRTNTPLSLNYLHSNMSPFLLGE